MLAHCSGGSLQEPHGVEIETHAEVGGSLLVDMNQVQTMVHWYHADEEAMQL